MPASRPPGWAGGGSPGPPKGPGGGGCGCPASRPPPRCGAAYARQRAPGERSRYPGAPTREPAPLTPLLAELARKPPGGVTAAQLPTATPVPALLPPPSCARAWAGVFLTGVASPDSWELGGGRAHLPSLDPLPPPPPPPVLQKLKAGEGGLVRALEAYPPYLWKLGSCSQHGPQLTPDHSFEQRWVWGGVCGVNLLPPQYAGPSEFPRLL